MIDALIEERNLDTITWSEHQVETQRQREVSWRNTLEVCCHKSEKDSGYQKLEEAKTLSEML